MTGAFPVLLLFIAVAVAPAHGVAEAAQDKAVESPADSIAPPPANPGSAVPVDSTAPASVNPAAEVDRLWSGGHRTEALDRGWAALREARAAGDSATLAVLLEQRGAQQLSMGQARVAEPLLREGLAIAAAQGDSALACRTRRWLSVAVGLLGRRDEARRLYDQLLVCAGATRQEDLQGWAHVGMGWDASQRGEYSSAATHYGEAVRLFRDCKAVSGELWALNGLAVARRNQGDLDGARDGYREVIKRAHGHDMPMVAGIALNNLANLEWTVGDPGRAMEGFSRAAAFQLSFGQRREAIIPRINLAHSLAALGDVAAARDTLRACLDESREMAAPDLESMTLESLGRLDLQEKRWSEAALSFRRSLALSEKLRFDASRNSMLGLSTALARQDSSRAALAVLRPGQQWCEQGADLVFCARLQLAWGERLLEQGAFADAITHLQVADSTAASGGIQTLRLAALTSIADALRRLDRHGEARTVLENAVQVWEAERDLPADPDWRSLRGAQGKRLFTDLARAYLRPPDKAASDSLAKGSPEQGEELVAKASGGPVKAFDMLQRYKGRGLLERLRGPVANSSQEDDFQPVKSSFLQSEVLEEGELFLDVYLGPDVSILFAVDRTACKAIFLPPESDLEPRISILREELSFPRGGLSPEVLDEIVGALSKSLFGPIQDELAKARRVFFSPDGVLNLLPPALFEPEGGPSWSRIPSAGLLAHLRRRSDGDADPSPFPPGILVLSAAHRLDGHFLPGVEEEVHWLSHHFEAVEKITGADQLQDREILHVAAHTIADDTRPWRSRIILDSGHSLTARNLMEAKSDPQLAVLASCGSAAGRTLSGEGVQSLSTALLAGGAQAVVATLWPVEDEATFSFMRLFYTGIAQGLSAQEALHRAQWTFRKSKETAHPFYWAAFILEGDPGLRVRLQRRSAFPVFSTALGVVLLLLLALFFRWGRRRV